MITYKALDDSTVADFRRLFANRFPNGDDAIVDRMMANPLRIGNRPTGMIAYDEDGQVVAIQGVAPRKAYWCRTDVHVALAMVMAVARGTSRDFLTPFLKEAIGCSGADLMFGNTAIPGSRKRLGVAVGTIDGPKGFEAIRGMTLRRSPVLWRRLRPMLSKLGVPVAWHAGSRRISLGTMDGLAFWRLPEIDAVAFDGFWSRYLETNEGLVGSRTAKEVAWMFEKGMCRHEVELIGVEREGALCGYAFLRRTDDTAACWRVMDMIALRNDCGVLEGLLRASSAFLRAYTPAECMQITGYPDSVEPLVTRLFPERAEIGFNRCVWKCMTLDAAARFGNWVDDAKSWYGCPYDGDMCLM